MIKQLLGLLIGFAAIALPKKASASIPKPGDGPLPHFGPAVVEGWQVPLRARKRAAPYLDAIRQAEDRYALPRGLLKRLLWQESRFRPEIINGALKSEDGATGIAQIIPRWHPGAVPTDPFHSIDYAASYLRRLHNRFGDWPEALAAYNWGPTNLSKVQGDWLQGPLETRTYVSGILRDTGLA